MKYSFIAICGLSLMCASHMTHAQDTAQGTPVPLIQVEKQELKAQSCHLVQKNDTITHQPRADVTHRPRADVSANDTGSNAFAIADPISIPITINVLDYMNIDRPEIAENMLKGDSTISNVFIYSDGRIVYNGEDITSKFETLCSE